MRIANVAGRATLVVDAGGIDIERASNGKWPSDPLALMEEWGEFIRDAEGLLHGRSEPLSSKDLGAPIPNPRQVFAVAMNYPQHAEELEVEKPRSPSVFTKYPSCISGPNTQVFLPEGNVDWEAEVVAVVGRRGHNVSLDEAWTHIAGITAGQDLSERVSQFEAALPQFSLAKSFPGFGPTGPYLVTVDELPDPDDIGLSAELNGVVVQDDSTASMLHSIPALVTYLSRFVTLMPGDLIFTGTPNGVGVARNPQRFLRPGEKLVTRVEHVGELTTRFCASIAQ